MSEESAPTPTRCDAETISVGDRLSRIAYYEVIEVDEDKGTFTLQNEKGFKFRVTRNIVEQEMFSAAQFNREVKLTRTELVEKMEGAGDACFTVIFNKQVTDKGMAQKLAAMDKAGELDLTSDRTRRALARELLVGQERRLVGYLVSSEPKLGRSVVVDLEVPEDSHNIRLVDHRTVTALILKNVRYFCD